LRSSLCLEFVESGWIKGPDGRQKTRELSGRYRFESAWRRREVHAAAGPIGTAVARLAVGRREETSSLRDILTSERRNRRPDGEHDVRREGVQLRASSGVRGRSEVDHGLTVCNQSLAAGNSSDV